MKLITLSLTMIVFICILTSCSDDKGAAPATATTTGVSALTDLPGATTSVTGAYSGDTYLLGDGTQHPGRGATTGQILSSVAINNFTAATNKTRAGCEATALLKSTYEMATQPDKIKCYVGKIVDNLAALGYDNTYIDTTGNYNYWRLSETGFTGYVKFKFKKGASGLIEEFEMFDCMNPERAGTQGSYMSTTITGSSVAMSQKFIHEWSQGGSTGDFYGEFAMTGTLSGSRLTSKQLTVTHESSWNGSWGTGTRYGKTIVDEYLSTFKINAHNYSTGTGSWSYNSSTYNFANEEDVKIFGVTELLNATPGKMSTLAVGDGSLKAIISNKNKSSTGAITVADAQACTTSTGDCWVKNETVTQTWLGDTLEAGIFNGDSYGYTEVNETTPTLSQTDPTIGFTSAQTWDCTTIAASDQSAGITLKDLNIGTAAMQAKFAECNAVYGFNQGQHLECWQLEDRN